MTDKLIRYFETHERVLYWICAALLLPALLINLGLGAIMMDEPTRALVALEMIFSGNYVTPTLFGEYYYNKPPFYNWILIAIFQLSGDDSEWAIRLPVVFFLLAYGVTIFYFVKRHFHWKVAFFAAIMFVTCGRMLILSSFVGHIDIFYSWITFLSFMAVYHYHARGNWLLLFWVSYALAAIGFLCKGLPSIVFQGSTLLAFLIWHKEWRRLFSWQHISGGLLFLLIVGSYFWAYSQYHSLVDYFPTLWYESSRRTPIHKAWYESLLHLITFPFETLMHLLPWSLLVLYALRKDYWNKIRQEPFLSFCLLLLLANIVPYWLSPETRPRYLFMLFPLLLTLIGYAYYHYRDQSPKLNRWIETAFLVGSILASLAVWSVPFIEVVKELPLVWLKTVSLFLGLAMASWLFYRLPAQRFVLFAIVLLLFRIGFDWFIIPHRYLTGTLTPYQRDGIKIAELTRGEALFVQEHLPINHDLGYYITRERKQILRHNKELATDAFYICDDIFLQSRSYDLYLDFHQRSLNQHLNLVKFKNEPQP